MDPDPPVTPDTVLNAMTAYQHTAALRAAIELGLVTELVAGADTAQALAERCGTSPRGMRALCDFLVAHGHLTKTADTYAPTEESRTFLDARAPAYLGETLEFLGMDVLQESFDALTDAVRRGGSAATDEGTTAEGHPAWVAFARAMGPLALPQARTLADLLAARGIQPRSVLDIAAGHGYYGIECARRFPEARVVGLDWKIVLEVAREHAREEGVAERYSGIEGSAFEQDFGSDHDVVLVPNFLHHFDRGACVDTLKRAHDALRSGGHVVVLEIAPDASRITPPRAAAFALVMIATTPAGDAYTVDEIRAMLEEAGFADITDERLPRADPCILIGRRP